MINSKWILLSEMEKRKLIAEICHIAQADDLFFDRLCKMRNQAERMGLLEGVKIFPDEFKPEKITV